MKFKCLVRTKSKPLLQERSIRCSDSILKENDRSSSTLLQAFYFFLFEDHFKTISFRGQFQENITVVAEFSSTICSHIIIWTHVLKSVFGGGLFVGIKTRKDISQLYGTAWGHDVIAVVISLSGMQLCLSHPRICVFVHNFISIMIIIIHLQTNLANVSIIKLYPASAANYTDETWKHTVETWKCTH